MAEKMDIDVCAFDWSGTVSDDRRPVYEANMLILDKYGKQKLTFEHWLRETMADVIDFLKKFDINDNPNMLRNLYVQQLNQMESDGCKPVAYPDAKDVFSYLNGMGKRIAILSTHPESKLIEDAKRYGLLEHLSIIKGSSRNKAEDVKNHCLKAVAS